MLKRITCILIALIYTVSAQYERPGSSTAQFLKIDVSPRGAGMAGAYISVVEGAEGAFYNPAVIATLEGTDIVINHNEWFAGINHEFLAVARSFGDYGSFALSAIGFYTDEMIVRTPLQPDGTGETFYAGAYQFGLSYARNLTDRVSLGGSIKYLELSLYTGFSEGAITADISANYSAGFRDWRFALAILNFGESMTFVNEEYPMPTLFSFGMSINAIEASEYDIKVAGSAKKPNEGTTLGQMGVEFEYIETFFLRAGYNLGHDVATYALGLGINTVIVNDIRFRLDYALNDFSQLGLAHRFGIGLSF